MRDSSIEILMPASMSEITRACHLQLDYHATQMCSVSYLLCCVLSKYRLREKTEKLPSDDVENIQATYSQSIKSGIHGSAWCVGMLC